jgi:hypothetical protein
MRQVWSVALDYERAVACTDDAARRTSRYKRRANCSQPRPRRLGLVAASRALITIEIGQSARRLADVIMIDRTATAEGEIVD